MNRKQILDDYYKNDDEDSRLIKDKAHSIEFITTTKYIDKYLKPDSKILEVGAATGRYSLYYAEKGYDVTAIDYVEHNIDILKSKITDNMNIKAFQGDALDLSNIEDNTYDITLVLGPLYHLYNNDDINKCISEAIRVTKPCGIIMLAYITNDAVFVHWGINHLVDGYHNHFDDTFKLKRSEEEIFAPIYVDEFLNIMKNYNVEKLHNITTDGLAQVLEDRINNLSDEEFDIWLKYHFSICEREDLIGYGCHILYIGQKK